MKKKKRDPEDNAPCCLELSFCQRGLYKFPELVKHVGKGKDQPADQDHGEPHAELAGNFGALHFQSDPFHAERIPQVQRPADPADDPVGREFVARRAQEDLLYQEFIIDASHNSANGDGQHAAKNMSPQHLQMIHKGHLCFFLVLVPP